MNPGGLVRLRRELGSAKPLALAGQAPGRRAADPRDALKQKIIGKTINLLPHSYIIV